MTQAQLDRAVTSASGESLRTIRRLGFSLLPDAHDAPLPEELGLFSDCPFCGRPLPYPGRTSDGSAAMGECLRCDVYFEVDPREVYAAERAIAC